MLVAVPVLCAVYRRRDAQEPYRFSHLWRTEYHKPVPETLAVTDLRHFSHDMCMCGQGHMRAPVLVLVSGDSADVLTLANWTERRQPVRYSPESFPASPPRHGADMDGGFVLVPCFSTLCFFELGEGVWRLRSTLALQGDCVPVPPVLAHWQLGWLRGALQGVMQRARRTGAWLVGATGYSERHLRPRPSRRGWDVRSPAPCAAGAGARTPRRAKVRAPPARPASARPPSAAGGGRRAP